MSTGYLQLSVFNRTVGSPLPNAKITITNSNQKTQEELITNESGQSDTVNLEAPPVDYSLEPNAPKPYSEYDVTVKQEGFDDVLIKGVQILADVVAEQNVFLQRNPATGAQELIYSVPDHTLYGEYPPKIAEDSVKPLPAATGFVVLSQPVIPEFIVVHDGVPSDNSAPNYWIPYKDYIKNVASSEIYATWPSDCIRANVLAIISFTLNRVYTEWYRSRGKNFTITTSTAYDQKFVYQRNFYKEISIIVDEIFSTFVTKPNIEQPLFTQYCDGKNVTCPQWLSQWGSKDLAASGSDYMNILRNYYGTEIYLDTAKEVLGVPSSYPGTALQIGASGNNVSTIQTQLNSISNNYPAIIKIPVSGSYDQATVDAVKAFQKIFKLPESGIVDYSTWYEISKIYTAVNRLA